MNIATDQDYQLGKWLAGAALGAAVMYMLDPERGAPRRAASGRRLRALGRHTGDVLEQVVHGIGARTESVVGAAAGRAAEAAEPEARAPAEAEARPAPRPDGIRRDAWLADARWRPATRGAALAGGGALGLVGLLSARSTTGLVLALAGLALLARGASNRPLRTLIGRASQGQAVEVEKTIRIDAAPEQVYDAFANYENFPRFMSNVVSVRDLGNRRSHWVVKGPAGTEFAWNAVLTEQDRPHRLAWRSEPGAEVEQAGTIRIEPFRDGTRVSVQLSYRPPAGAVGHALASLLGSDPKRQMDDDLARMKSFLERGNLAHPGPAPAGTDSKFLH